MAINIKLTDDNNNTYHPVTTIDNVEGLREAIVDFENTIAVSDFVDTGDGTQDGNSKLRDIRMDSLGIVHRTAGNAIRDGKKIKTVTGVEFGMDENWVRGYVELNENHFLVNDTCLTSGYIVADRLVGTDSDCIKVYCPLSYYYKAVFYDADKNLITDTDTQKWYIDQNEFTKTENGKYVRFCIRRADGKPIEMLERTNLFVANCDMSDEPKSINFHDELRWIDGYCFERGRLTARDGVKCTQPILLWEGAAIQFSAMYETHGEQKGVAVSLWKDEVWVMDISPGEMYNASRIVIPKGCNRISLTMYNDSEEKYVRIYQNIYKVNNALILLALKTCEDKLVGKTISILGDSVSTFGDYTVEEYDENGNLKLEPYADGTYVYPGNHCRYPISNKLEDVNQTWWMTLINRHHMILEVNDSWAGSRVAWDNGMTDENDGEDIHAASMTRINHLSKTAGKSPDIILVYVGANDMGRSNATGTFSPSDPTKVDESGLETLEVDTFAEAYATMLIRLMHKYKESNIICILPYFAETYINIDIQYYFSDKMIEICDYYGIEYVDERKCGTTVFNAGYYCCDRVHYNPEGMVLVANEIEKKLMEIYNC